MSTNKKTTQYLALSVLGSDQIGIANELYKLASHCNCDIVDGKMTTLGTEFAGNLLLTGTWNAIAKFEASVPAFEKKHDARVNTRRSQLRPSLPNYLPYVIYIIAINQPGVLYKITQFFAERGINVHDLYVNTYTAPFCDTQMLSISISVTILKTQLLADFRESLMLFCDDHNFDVILEPQKI